MGREPQSRASRPKPDSTRCVSINARKIEPEVFPAHGSGITPQLLAARILVKNISEGRGVLGYEKEFQRTWGGLSAGYDVFRRFSQTLPLEDLARLMSCTASIRDPGACALPGPRA